VLVSVLTVAGGTFQELSTPFGVLNSQNFPSPYANNLDDVWTVTVPRGYRVVLYFSHFDLEDSFGDKPCVLDYVEVISF